MRTGVYVRVSTRDQTTESQLRALERWVAAQEPGSVVWPTPYEDSFTGRTMKRPGFTALMDAVRRRDIDRVVVWKLDRLGRTTKGLCELFEELLALDVDLVSLTDGLTLKTPSGRLLARILASVAEFETEIRAERIKAGIDKARDKETGKCPWGGSVKGDPRWRKITDEQIAAMREMRAAGKPVAQIARLFGIARKTVYDYVPASGVGSTISSSSSGSPSAVK